MRYGNGGSNIEIGKARFHHDGVITEIKQINFGAGGQNVRVFNSGPVVSAGGVSLSSGTYFGLTSHSISASNGALTVSFSVNHGHHGSGDPQMEYPYLNIFVPIPLDPAIAFASGANALHCASALISAVGALSGNDGLYNQIADLSTGTDDGSIFTSSGSIYQTGWVNKVTIPTAAESLIYLRIQYVWQTYNQDSWSTSGSITIPAEALEIWDGSNYLPISFTN